MSLISRLHHVLEGSVKDRFVELRTSTPMEELRRVANLEDIPLERLKFVERLEDGEYGLLDMEENIFYRTAKDVERGFETYSGTIMTFEDPEVKKVLVASIGGEQGITNRTLGVVGVKGIAGEVTYEQALATRGIYFDGNKSIRIFNELVYFKNLTSAFFRDSSIEEVSLPYMSISDNSNFFNCNKLRKLTTKYGLDVRGNNFLRGCSSLQSLDTSKWNLSNLTSGDYMFNGCSSLQSLDTSKWNLSNLTSGSNMFRYINITTLDVREWNLSRLTNATYMFSYTPISTLDTSGWRLNNLLSAANMFEYCSNLISLGDTSRWGLEKLTNASAMFHNCRALQSLDTSGWRLENVVYTRHMFDSCNALTSLGDTSRWNLIRCIDMQNLFVYCIKLTKVDLTYSSTPQLVVNNLISTLWGIDNLESIVGDHTETDNVSVFNGFNTDNFDIRNLTLLNLASILAIIRGLGISRTRRRFFLPSGFDKSRIPQEYKTMLENKNWELA